ncbi:putative glycerol-3-phosphate 2-O-acyltransferase [Helianthus anomalus]
MFDGVLRKLHKNQTKVLKITLSNTHDGSHFKSETLISEIDHTDLSQKTLIFYVKEIILRSSSSGGLERASRDQRGQSGGLERASRDQREGLPLRMVDCYGLILVPHRLYGQLMWGLCSRFSVAIQSEEHGKFFHDGRLAFRPKPLSMLVMFMWFPFAILLSIFSSNCCTYPCLWSIDHKP